MIRRLRIMRLVVINLEALLLITMISFIIWVVFAITHPQILEPLITIVADYFKPQ